MVSYPYIKKNFLLASAIVSMSHAFTATLTAAQTCHETSSIDNCTAQKSFKDSAALRQAIKKQLVESAYQGLKANNKHEQDAISTQRHRDITGIINQYTNAHDGQVHKILIEASDQEEIIAQCISALDLSSLDFAKALCQKCIELKDYQEIGIIIEHLNESGDNVTHDALIDFLFTQYGNDVLDNIFVE